MTEDQIAFLKLAFRELECFTLPGIGTFVKTLAGARLDPKTNVIYPPTERFEFESKGEGFSDYFPQLLMRRQLMTHAEASEVVQGIATEILGKLESSGTFEINGIGKLTKAEDNFAFELTNEDPTLQTFGLNPVTIEGAEALKLEDKSKKKKKPKNEKTKKVKKEKAPKEGRKKSKVMFIVLIVLLLGLAAIVVLAWPEIEKMMSGEKPKKEAPVKKKKKPKKEKASEPIEEEVPEEEPEEEAPIEEETKPKETPPAKAEVKRSVTYQLIHWRIHPDEATAQKAAADWKKYGGRVIKVGNGYAVLLGTASSKAALNRKVQQMENNNDIYPGEYRILP